MIERSEIFSSVLKRNRLRLDNGLPPLHIKEEFDKAVAIALENDFQNSLPDLFENYKSQHEVIHNQVVSEIDKKYGKNYHTSASGSYLLRRTVTKRFDAFLREKHGSPPLVVNGIIYGGSIGID